MRLWRITPSAPPNDLRWLGGPVWREIVVRAGTAAEARVVAARMEADQQGFRPGENTAGAAAMGYQSALYDEALYHVAELPEGGSGPLPGRDQPEIVSAQRLGTP